MAELENWRYYSASYQTIREISNRPHQVPQTIPKIHSQSRTNYKQYLKVHSDFYWWHCYLPVVQHSIPQWGYQHYLFVWQKYSQILRVNQDIDMKWQVETDSGAQHILQLCCAHTRTTKYWNRWTIVKESWEETQDNNELILRNTIINSILQKITDMIQWFSFVFQDSEEMSLGLISTLPPFVLEEII